ncbi:hypothetical protein PPYR_09239 [Photinus pyralis]|uniref:non-specific serine/threonine protein kinase n=4 Tax=Photinus pyralis TaxID=7054 RepID=A0A5N4ALV9_PHOPY|nr:eukaryotic translation initiation factor 2-alpha kinase 3-like [Photinus pyralis]XP_031344941.1 eukaryotic translation initiation factor 2-alpha kinase 3-like [Photinus pyralis]XP_031344942.1 eukaryotic translation initiation factor 2-alpha kinase 3-like [Photinus pyralis]XP_031344943.1 eukaryotic translation initiation factor 2-alpha kinase 3-like [Photinus pyralis]KAB0798243.1 hypothetical protein PPYR_09236 [Photinus pyralis]KAB0798246.1 hypothetical protein PPYR_09239 [Photinus pyralis]
MAKSGMSGSKSNEKKASNNRPKKSSTLDVKNPTPETINNVNTVCKPKPTSTPTSILIESLVKNLCSICEPDEQKSEKIYNFICSKLFEMKLVDESYNMIEFEGMRNQYQRALYHLVTSAIGKQPVPSLQAFWQNNDITNEWSHYYREFDEIEYIAGGGFGQVYRVKHKLDGTDYAIKKIVIRSEGIKSIRNYLSEVKTFASLNHSNVVQYKAAWLELGGARNKQVDNNVSYTTEPSDHNLITGDADQYIYPDAATEMDTFTQRMEESDFEVSFQATSEIHQYSQSSNSIFNSDRKVRRSARVKRNSISEGGNAICKLDEIESLYVQAKSELKWATLYIQMALCQTTLRHWLEKRYETEHSKDSALISVNMNQVHYDSVMEILRQLLLGIEYIHSKRIVHHDIKPSNIFIQIDNGRLLVQLGDFGLACPLQSVKHSLAFGTKLYAAPEQLAGKCDSKSDMYSLGIVLFELVMSFSTDMERIRTITELRRNGLGSDCLASNAQFTAVIKDLMARHPGDRPDATTLMQRLRLNLSESDLVQELRSQLAQKDDEILRLQTILKNAGLHAT